MKRVITQRYNETFCYDDFATVGYMVGGELVVEKPSKSTMKQFEGDWCPVTQADVWSWIHNSDRRQSVTFWHSKGHAAVTYFPRHDQINFRVIHWHFKD